MKLQICALHLAYFLKINILSAADFGMKNARNLAIAHDHTHKRYTRKLITKYPCLTESVNED